MLQTQLCINLPMMPQAVAHPHSSCRMLCWIQLLLWLMLQAVQAVVHTLPGGPWHWHISLSWCQPVSPLLTPQHGASAPCIAT